VTCKGVDEFANYFEKKGDDYQSIMVKALGDRFAEGFAEYLHHQIRIAWGYGKSEPIANFESMILEEYRGIRPAPGYPACPEHTEKRKIWNLMKTDKAVGIKLTESCAMFPGSSVSGFYFSHPESKYFSVGKIDRDQVADYAARKGMTLAEAEKWLAPNLGY
jgi:5-methyltetrahydrofolate--homocysteine methyltransferase